MKNITILNDLNTLNKLHTSSVESYTTNNGIADFTCDNAGYVDNVVIEGETLVNLVRNDLPIQIWHGDRYVIDLVPCDYLKGTYTIFNFSNKKIYQDIGVAGNTNTWLKSITIEPRQSITFDIVEGEQISNVSGAFIDGWENNDTSKNEFRESIVILKGDHADKPIRYFAGIKSVGQGDKIEVLTRNQSNKNLFYGDVELGYIDNKTGINGNSVNGVRSVEYIKVDKNTTYTVSDDKGYNVSVNLYGENKSEYFGEIYGKTPYTFTTDDKTYWIRLRTFTGSKQNDITIKWQLEKGNKLTEYVQPKYDKKQISTTLRSLPNGVKDTIEKIGNKYVKVQRCGEVVLDGNINVHDVYKPNNSTSLNYHRFLIKVKETPNFGDVFCDRLGNVGDYEIEKDNILGDKTHSGFFVTLHNDKTGGTREGFKTWLQANPVTVVYELETPQIIELPNFNPQTFEGENTLILNSGVIQCDASFDVCKGIRSELDVIKDKVSNLDNYINPNKIDFTSQCSLLNGWKVWGKHEFFNAFVVDNCVKVTCLIWQGTTDAYTSILKIPKMYAPTSREFIPMISDSGSCVTACLDPGGYLTNESKISNFNWISFNFTYPLSK